MPASRIVSSLLLSRRREHNRIPGPNAKTRRGLKMADDRDFIQRAESASRKLHGAPVDDDKMAENFALCGSAKRASMLERFDTELRGEIDSSPHNLRRRAQLIELRRKMGGVHDALRKARR
jgi:hypothetical protein